MNTERTSCANGTRLCSEMTPRQAASILLMMYEGSCDKRQQDALGIAITHLRNRIDVLDREYLRGFRDAKRKGEAV